MKSAGAGAAGADPSDGEPVCEECSQAKNLIHCIDASIQVEMMNQVVGNKVAEEMFFYSLESKDVLFSY